MKRRRYVYLLRDRIGRLVVYKLGSSCRPASRLHDVAITDRAELVHRFESDDAYGVEYALHRKFSDRRAWRAPGREWFRLTADDVASIMALGRTDSPDELPESLRVPVMPKESVSVASDILELMRQICFHERDRRGRPKKLTELFDELVRPKAVKMLQQIRLRKESQ